MSSKVSRRGRRQEQRDAAKAPGVTLQPLPFIPPTPDDEVLHRLLGGAGEINDKGVFSIEADAAWIVEPWLWTPGNDPDPSIYQKLDTAPPVAIFLNRDYTVSVFNEPGPQGWPAMWHLSIKRRDRAPIDEDRWRILQRIKNSLLGPEHEAVELYPAESRLVDTANQYHLWCLQEDDMRFPFGFNARLVTDASSSGAVQRPMDHVPTPEEEAVFAETLRATLDD